ncbi:MAG: hypothetical protein IH872_06035, partial [Chloroflexi bacterium]|nr:hypothetical protein [Chloroflexota bacterium]
MRRHVNQDSETSAKAAEERTAAGAREARSGAMTTDNRPESVQLSRLQSMADNSPDAAKIAQLLAMVNQRTRTPLKIVTQLFRNDQYEAIYKQLNAFHHAWTADGVAADVCGAYDDLAARMGLVGIALGDNAGSRAANPLVRGLWIGEIIDMIRT